MDTLGRFRPEAPDELRPGAISRGAPGRMLLPQIRSTSQHRWL